jgi:uncharacterized protein with PIN domain
MPTMVIDACAMIALLEDEDGADVVEGIITNPANECVAHFVNMSEVHTHYVRQPRYTVADADAAVVLLTVDAGIEVRDDADEAFWKDVATVRGRIQSTVKNPATGGCHSIALADCFAVALAHRTGGTIVTSDHDDFEHVRDAGYCNVHFFRPRR